MHEALHTLQKLRAGYVWAMSNACSQIDALLDDYANLVKVKSIQATLDKAWKNFAENATRYRSLLDENGIRNLPSYKESYYICWTVSDTCLSCSEAGPRPLQTRNKRCLEKLVSSIKKKETTCNLNI